jgi:hypothetical protein
MFMTLDGIVTAVSSDEEPNACAEMVVTLDGIANAPTLA